MIEDINHEKNELKQNEKKTMMPKIELGDRLDYTNKGRTFFVELENHPILHWVILYCEIAQYKNLIV